MEEILYELRDYGCALNAGRWDYIFSVIKKLGGACCPTASQVTMTVPFMRAYTELLVRSCHRRGAHAIGGMAAFIPSRTDPEVNEIALAKVREDKERESGDGFDGTWVAHPDLVPVATEVFDARARRAAEPGRAAARGRRRRRRAAAAARLRRPRRHGHRRRAARERLGRRPLPRRVAARHRRGRDRQPDGGRRHRRDRRARRCGAGCAPGRFDAAPRRAQELELVDAGDEAKALFAEVALGDELVEFLTLPAYARLA